jgi:anti-sigma regulatory factor (Ser/Thr protein kinase)
MPILTVRTFSDSAEFAPQTAMVSAARVHVRETLRRWGLEKLSTETESVVAELAANSVEAHVRENRDDPFRITLVGWRDRVLIMVRDASPRPPVLGDPGTDGECGRGLLIVDALSAQWDFRLTPEGGKVIQALIKGSVNTADGHRSGCLAR